MIHYKKIIIITSFIISLIFIITGICLVVLKADNELTILNKLAHRISPSTGNDMETSYLNETCYDGTVPIYKEVFQIPFKKSEDSYIMNKTLYAQQEEKVSLLQEKATTFIETMLGTGYREISKDSYTYQDTMLSFFDTNINSAFVLDDGDVTTPEIFFDDFENYIKDHEIQADVKFQTDKSLVYADGYYYVRGVLSIETYSYINPEETNLLPDGISYSEDSSCIFEIALKNTSPDSNVFYVTQYQKLADLDTYSPEEE